MKRKMLAALLCLALLLPVLPAAAAVWDAPIDTAAAVVGEGAVLTQNTYWTGSDYRVENYLELAGGAALRPVVYSGDTLCSAASLNAAAAALEARGLHTVAGVNGGYYTMSSYVPVGPVVRDGVLRSAAAEDAWMRAAGFRADGSAVIGKPLFRLTLTAGETRLTVAALNRPRGDGITLYTSDFAANTKASGTGWNVVCAADGPIPLSGSVTLTVEEITADDGATALPENSVLLSLAGDTEAEPPEWLAALSAGAELTLTVSCAEGWEDVESAVGLLYMLIEDGAAVPDLDPSAAPRSAVGVRADGSVVLYTVDGRQTGYSVGAGLSAVAQRLLELGCVAAGALDGGASTNLSAVLPGDGALSQINRPSGGSPRSVVNYVFLVTEAQPSGTAARLALYPLDIDAVAGASVALTVKAVDENGYPAPVPEGVQIAVSGGFGTVENGVFRADKTGSGTITVSAQGLESASIPVSVTESPDEIALYGEVYGRLTRSLTLEPGQEVDLTVRALSNHVRLTGADECYTWTLEPDGGTVDETGHVIPAAVSGSGLLTVSAGETRTQIPITVWSGVPFRDVLTTDPYFAAVRYTYENDLFKGMSETAFAPETVMTRGMLVTVLWRMNGEPEPETERAFADVAPEDWYGPAVAWASETGLVQGYGDCFGPLDELTKEQILAILWRWAGQPETEGSLAEIADGGDVSAYAVPALVWALDPARRLIEADGDDSVLPRLPMTRAAVAEVLMRYLESK